jgi:glycosyltransferase involved in cell wall biosynthesis
VNKISFLGRISKYKGVELFIEAIELTNKNFPDEQYWVAGKPIGNYYIPKTEQIISNLKLELKHLSNQELTDIISDSKVIVCPYIESTQSGVIMTAYALCKPVIVTNVGGLPEYVKNNTGIICEPDPLSLNKAIEELIQKHSNTNFSNQIKLFSEDLRLNFRNSINNVYTNE